MQLSLLPSQTYRKARKQIVELPQTLADFKQRLLTQQGGAVHPQAEQTLPDYEVLIIGAGVSGIDMGCHLQQRYRDHATALGRAAKKKFLIVEKRADMGGTWDLFKYPGIRSDSDMFTFGFAHRPWLSKKTLTDGASIKAYIQQTATDEHLDEAIRYQTEVKKIDWSSQDKYWTATLYNSATGMTQKITASFIVGATGYYDYDQGYQPDFPGQEDFKGQLIHPQQWAEDTDYHDKKIVIIGSGATAVTLLPALLDTTSEQQAAHVTMLQRSPTYIANVPSVDEGVHTLTGKLPLNNEQAYTLVRWKNILTQQGIYRFAKVAPKAMKFVLTHKAQQDLKGSGVSLSHFNPDYNPWDERLCAVPDGDLFQALQSDNAEIVTDEIERFTADGIQLRSGRHLEADIIVSATGLTLQMLGGAAASVDRVPVAVGERMTYKAVLVEGIPNMAVMFGYTNASWTLKIDLACDYLLRLFDHMDRHRYQSVVAQAYSETGEQVQRQADTVMGALSAGYIQRAKDVLPKQGDRYPWLVTNNYMTDRIMLKYRGIADEWLNFQR
ncbi:NAD(P)/FAD-dependent oxidoreductase [Psychrobacter arenosus]|uniref:flavin-containing monooxygenase n=1 Tax=Psychrobacter arenosus TaxID=256326 RepID=UPI001919CC44|nr:NAD(P)/FAD-dependent oxidoreductase [Psychrobacter arenosus]